MVAVAADALVVKADELPFRKQFDVLQIVRSLEALFVGQRGKHHALERFHRGRVSGSRRRDRQAIRKDAVIGYCSDTPPRPVSVERQTGRNQPQPAIDATGRSMSVL